jgi:hypothetical protein
MMSPGKIVVTPLGLWPLSRSGSQGNREARQPWAKLLNRFAVASQLLDSFACVTRSRLTNIEISEFHFGDVSPFLLPSENSPSGES